MYFYKQFFLKIITTSLIFLFIYSCSKENSDNTKNQEKQNQASNTNILAKPSSRAEAIRFLKGTSFTIKEKDISILLDEGYEEYINKQFDYKYTSSTERLFVLLNQLDSTIYTSSKKEDLDERYANTDRFKIISRNIWWDESLNSESQLRLRVAHALSQIIIVSFESPAGNLLRWRGEAMAYYFDILKDDAFKTYKDLLKDITYSPAMAYFMTYAGSSKYDEAKGTSPDENYARELMQIFTIGIKKLNIDGSAKLDKNNNFIATYTQDDVSNNAKIFTGWFFHDKNNDGKYGKLRKKNYTYTKPIEFHHKFHDTSDKVVLGQTIKYSSNGKDEINKLIDILYNHENIAPFISQKLIKRLTSSNPSKAYVKRVAEVFNNDGNNIKGNLKAVIKAILLDKENLSANHDGNNNFGKANELIISFTQTLSQLNVKAPSGWKYKDKKISNETYWIDSKKLFGQSAMQSPDVFNFYSKDFIPNDEAFQKNNLVAPELQIQTANNLIKYSNELFQKLQQDKYACMTLKLCGKGNYKSMDERYFQKSNAGTRLYYFDLTKFYNKFEEYLGGEVDDTFSNMRDSEKSNNAITKLVDFIDGELLGGVLKNSYKSKLIDFLKTQSRGKKAKVRSIVTNAILAIVTSPYYISIR